MRALFYYKLGKNLIRIGAVQSLQNWSSVITG